MRRRGKEEERRDGEVKRVERKKLKKREKEWREGRGRKKGK